MKNVQETRFRQSSTGWCSIYSIANMLGDSSALRFTDYSEFKGCDDKQENEILSFLGSDLRLLNIAFSQQQHKTLPHNYIFDIISCTEIRRIDELKNIEIPIIPILLTVKLIPGEMWHRVYVFYHNGDLYYSDPYRSHILKLECANDLTNLFLECCSVDRLGIMVDEVLNFAYLNGEKMGYNWLIEKL